jgi:integrase
MPRKQTWPPPVHHHRRSGQARVRINGKDYYLGPYGSPEAEEALAALLVRHARGELGGRVAAAPAAPRTVADVAAEWLAEAAPGYSARGREPAHFRRSLAPLLRLYGTLPADQFDVEKLDRVRRAMLDGSWMTPAERQGLQARNRSPAWSARVVARRVVRLRTLWRWAERRALVPKGSWAHLRALPPLGPSEPARRLPRRKPAEWADVLAACRHLTPRHRAAVLTLWWSGARPGELRVMRPCDLDRSGPVWVYRPHEHKNDWRDMERVVHLGPRCQALLRPLLGGLGPEDHVFAGRGGPAAPLHPGTLEEALRKACAAAGVSFTAYQLRHAAKRRITRALGLDAARSVLGQASLDTTDRYAAGGDEKLAGDAARRLG